MEASVVIPTLRRTDRLGSLLEALCAQIDEAGAGGTVEIVVVDNCHEASARDVVARSGGASYVHEPRTGIAVARNSGVAAAQGRQVIFIDDDELPQPGWLAAFLGCLSAEGADSSAHFGPIDAEYAAPPAGALQPALEQIFSRRLRVADGQDITAMRAYLGTGNCMLPRRLCLAEPFEERFNSGGEDVWFLRRISEAHGVRLRWCAGARVRECVPRERMTEAFLRHRRFRNGQLRCIVAGGRPGLRGAAGVGFWMAVGLVQAGVFGTAALAARLARHRQAGALAIRSMGGLGKLLWWVTPPLPRHGGGGPA